MNLGNKNFLENFPTLQRSTVHGFFLRAVRDGADSPEAVVAQVRTAVETRLQEPGTDQNAMGKLGAIIHALREFPTEAANLAKHAIHWCALGQAERQAVRSAKDGRFRALYGRPSSAVTKAHVDEHDAAIQ